MYDRILFPTDGSDAAAAAVEHVLDVAAAHDATLHVLVVADTTQDSVVRVGGEVVDALEREGTRVTEAVADRARERGVDVVTEVLQGEPAATIVDYADAREMDLVVVPTHGRTGIERLLVGSTAARVVRRATVPVLTLRPDSDPPAYPYRTVLVPTDGSGGAAAALSAGIEVAAATGAALHVLSVVEATSLGVDVRSELQSDALESAAEEVVADAVADAEAAGVESVTGAVEGGTSVERTIRAYVDDHGVDLVVAGTHGRTGLDRYVLGSVAEALVRRSAVPVVTVRRPDDGDGS
jgi:nucleotide-binding universal stress UspA family protein